jgi:hypothetical protein
MVCEQIIPACNILPAEHLGVPWWLILRSRVWQMTNDRETLPSLIGLPLTGITFVMDYVQLHFRHITINAVSWPILVNSGGALTVEKEGYRDSLCDQLEKTVMGAYVQPGDRLQIEFAGATAIVVPLNLLRGRSAESAVYQDPVTATYYVW